MTCCPDGPVNPSIFGRQSLRCRTIRGQIQPGPSMPHDTSRDGPTHPDVGRVVPGLAGGRRRTAGGMSGSGPGSGLPREPGAGVHRRGPGRRGQGRHAPPGRPVPVPRPGGAGRSTRTGTPGCSNRSRPRSRNMAPGIEVLRPGMLACSIRGPARYFGSEQCRRRNGSSTSSSRSTSSARIGIADVAAGRGAGRPAVTDRPDRWLRRVLCGAAHHRAGPGSGDRATGTGRNWSTCSIRLGITTAGAFAALPEDKVATRFGADGVAPIGWPRGIGRTRACPGGRSSRRLTVEQDCDPPLDRVDTAAFAARALAERFHARLADRRAWPAPGCRSPRRTETGADAVPDLAVRPAADRGGHRRSVALAAGRLAHRSRRRLTPGPAPPGPGPHPATLDPTVGRPGAITRLRLEPIEAIGAGLIQYGLWGSDGQDDQRAGWAFARVQGLLGPESVLAPVHLRRPEPDGADHPGAVGGREGSGRAIRRRRGQGRFRRRHPALVAPGRTPPRSSPSPTRPGTRCLRQRPGSAYRRRRPTVAGERRGSRWAGPWLFDERWWSRTGAPARCRARHRQVARPTAAASRCCWRSDRDGWQRSKGCTTDGLVKSTGSVVANWNG